MKNASANQRCFSAHRLQISLSQRCLDLRNSALTLLHLKIVFFSAHLFETALISTRLPSINAKILTFPGLYGQNSKTWPWPSKRIRKLKFISLIARQKKNRRAKIWDMVAHDPVVGVIQKSDQIHRKVQRSLDLK